MIFSLIFSLYCVIAIIISIIEFALKLIAGAETLCLPASVIVWKKFDNLRVVPRAIIFLIAALITVPGEIVTAIFVGLAYIFAGIFYFIPWLCCKDRKRIAREWREHWTTNPFVYG